MLKNKVKLTDRQIDCLKVLKRAPKSNTQAFDQLHKKNELLSKGNVRDCMRRLENRGLVRAREKFAPKLNRTIIVWELTDKGRKALDK